MRRSKKQPEYDPNELADLIETPAVGSGVGSHLLSHDAAPGDVTTVVMSEPPSVVGSVSAPVDTTETTPIVPGRKSSASLPPEVTVSPALSPTIAISEVATVDIDEVTPVSCLEDSLKVTTVASFSQPEPLARLWISESGEIVPESRVRRVAAAGDALSTGEEALYHLLSRLPAVRLTADSRSVQAGYDILAKGTGFSRKTIQRTIDRLIAKHYIEIETPADIYRRTSTVYRVFTPNAAIDRLIRHACTHVAKIGPGVAFVTPLAALHRA